MEVEVEVEAWIFDWEMEEAAAEESLLGLFSSSVTAVKKRFVFVGEERGGVGGGGGGGGEGEQEVEKGGIGRGGGEEGVEEL